MLRQDFEDLFSLEENLWWFAGMRRITASLLDPLFSSASSQNVLDAGCGTGVNLSWLRRYSGQSEVVGMDIEADALEHCKIRGHKVLTRGSVTELPFASLSQDLVTSFDVLVQLPGSGADQRAAREIYRVLRPGGIFFARVAAYEWMRSGHDAALGTQRRYRLAELRHLLEDAGFVVLRATYANSALLPLAAIHRLVLKKLKLTAAGSDVKPLPPAFRWGNSLLESVLAVEARWLRLPRARLPAGLSAICIAQKPRD